MSTLKKGSIVGHPDAINLTIPKNITLGSTVIADSSAGVTTITAENANVTTAVQPGLAKMFLHTDKTESTQPNHYSLNVASITDSGTGFSQGNFINNLSHADKQIGTSSHSGWQHESSYGAEPNTTHYAVRHRTDGTTYGDIEFTFLLLHGDLA